MTNGQQLGRAVNVNAHRLRVWLEEQRMTLTLAWLTVLSVVGWTVTVIVCK